MPAGDYELFVLCVDFAGNSVKNSSEFTLELDTQEPFVTRIFGEGGSLVINTNEASRCFYRNDSGINCGYSVDNATEFSQGNTQTLSTQLIPEIDYFIQCQDIFENRPDSCSIVVRGYESSGY